LSSHFRLNAFVIQTKLNLGMNEDRLGGPPKWPLKGNLQRGVADFFLAIEQQVREKQQWGRQQRAHAERVAGNREYRQSGMQGTGSTCRACCREQGAQAERVAGNREHRQSVLQGTGSTGRAGCREQGAHAERVAGNREHRQSVLQGTGSTCRACCREQGAQAELDAAAAAAAAAKKTPVAEFRHHQQGG